MTSFWLAHSDYVTTTKKEDIYFEPDDVIHKVSIDINSDNIAETNETFNAYLTLPAGSMGVKIGEGEALVTIIDDDGEFSSNDTEMHHNH